MGNLFKIAIRNLLRYKRRTLMTASLITIGVIFVLGYIAIAGSFKNMMVAQITDSSLGHLQVHRKGYMAAVESLPLTMNLKPRPYKILEDVLNGLPEVEAYSPRIRFGGMFSNFVETTSIRLNGVNPDSEFRTVPLLPSRIINGEKHLNKGEILVPELLSTGMGVKPGDTVVIVTTNKDGSVNGKQFKVSGILESAQGPGGRDGYVTFEDAMEVLRMQELEVSEVAIRIKDFSQESAFTKKLEGLLSKELNQKGKPIFDVHPWEKLSPFYNIAQMIDVMSIFVKVMLVAIVLISIMNVMIMAVYERVREIGTIAAIGTFPSKILSMFVIEGFSLGVLGVIIGNLIGLSIIFVLNVSGITFDFGRQTGLILRATIAPLDVVVISGIVILVSVLASMQPAWKASRMEPITALRHV
ncbi:MAG: ABC transporter permease [Syntrophaceae bacterium]